MMQKNVLLLVMRKPTPVSSNAFTTSNVFYNFQFFFISVLASLCISAEVIYSTMGIYA